ncbi:hypothetical protein CERSUDRAFT_69719 [Gelatoporia subvermispora B]|uniref:Uncharacterized protein n=1 Tax=Ceriporiopsis subvermispora (strain B) TaxID=914234 RepID=M2QW95_CERS8|nr:hypothetical protein CERSUDRAFT_69719 [Gelatoporia subvermispora B]
MAREPRGPPTKRQHNPKHRHVNELHKRSSPPCRVRCACDDARCHRPVDFAVHSGPPLAESRYISTLFRPPQGAYEQCFQGIFTTFGDRACITAHFEWLYRDKMGPLAGRRKMQASCPGPSARMQLQIHVQHGQNRPLAGRQNTSI